MLQTHLRSIDLNLLPVLDALLRRRNATRAGEDVGLSQPAMSRALGRLRHLLDDDLIVRGPAGPALTPRAEALRDPLDALLRDLGNLLIEPPFDPAAESRTIRIALADSNASVLLPPLVARLAVDAPGVRMRALPVGPGTVDAMLRGEIDLALALDSTPLPPGTLAEPLGEDSLSLVRRIGHPTSGRPWRLDDYAAWPSVGIAFIGDGSSDLDAELARHGIRRQLAAVVTTFASALEIVAASDCVTTVSTAYAARLAQKMGLELCTPPLANTRLGLVTVWSEVRRNDRLLAWFRGVLREAMDGAPAIRR